MTGNDNKENEFLPEHEEREIMRILSSALASLPDVKMTSNSAAPAAVIEAALWIHDWHNMDAELAKLTFDSRSSSELSAVRSTSALRELTFVSGEVEIQIEVEQSDHGVILTGNVSPAMDGAMHVVVGGLSLRGMIDKLGTFVVDNVDHGTVLAFIETKEGTIRLGSFEV